jgi:hypothetical protein
MPPYVDPHVIDVAFYVTDLPPDIYKYNDYPVIWKP